MPFENYTAHILKKMKKHSCLKFICLNKDIFLILLGLTDNFRIFLQYESSLLITICSSSAEKLEIINFIYFAFLTTD